MPLPAGTRHGPALVPAALGRRGAVGVRRRARSRRAHFEDGHRRRPPPRRRRTSRCSCRSSWKAAGTRCRCSRPSRKPRYHELRPAARAATKAKASPFSEDETLMWHPQAAGPRAAARRRQGHGVPGDRLRPARREPLHEPPLLGGRRTEHPDALRLDGPLPGHRRRTRATRCRASRSTTRSRRRWPPRRCPWRPSPRPRTTTSGPTGWTNR